MFKSLQLIQIPEIILKINGHEMNNRENPKRTPVHY